MTMRRMSWQASAVSPANAFDRYRVGIPDAHFSVGFHCDLASF